MAGLRADPAERSGKVFERSPRFCDLLLGQTSRNDIADIWLGGHG